MPLSVRVLENLPKLMRGGLVALFGFMFVVLAAAPSSAMTARGFKMAGDASRTRIVLHFDREPDLRWFLLRAPHRLVIDIPETAFAVDAKELTPRGLVSGVRYGNLDGGRSRLILSSAGPFIVEQVSVMKNEEGDGFRLVADIVAGSQREFDAALAEQVATTGSTLAASKGDRIGQAAPIEESERRFRIVIDPGHGGIDPGAEGKSGTAEKDVTLGFSMALREALSKNPALEVFMTREKDEFLRLDERVRIARQHEADLLISIHADTINMATIRGATVYTMSEKASDAVAEAAAVRENLSDQIAGLAIEDENHEVADILVDLIRRETQTFSISFARSLVDELSTTVELIKNPHRSAGFRVLKAPDVPSVLVELGYLSNPKDESLLLDPEWRAKAVSSMASAVTTFANARRGAGG